MKTAFVVALIFVTSPVYAQDAVTYLGSFDTDGRDVSVTPLGDDRLEFCETTTSGAERCENSAYTLEDGIASFSSFREGRFEFDLVTNVLRHRVPDGPTKSADMTPVAR